MDEFLVRACRIGLNFGDHAGFRARSVNRNVENWVNSSPSEWQPAELKVRNY